MPLQKLTKRVTFFSFFFKKHMNSDEDDLSFFRSMIERRPQGSSDIDVSFLYDEIVRRRPPPPPRFRGIAMIEPQTQPSTRTPQFIKSAPRRVQRTFDDGLESFPAPEKRERKFESAQISKVRKIDKNKPLSFDSRNYVSWKYVGDTLDGSFGTLTGKIDAQTDREELRKDFANMPYVLEQYQIEYSHDKAKKKKRNKPRDLFALSIIKRQNDPTRVKPVTRLQQEMRIRQLQNELGVDNDTQIYLDTDQKKIPLTVSRLAKINNRF